MNLGRRRAKLTREALELEQEMSERIDVGPIEHVVILVRKLKKAVTALEGEVEKLGPGPKQFFAQAKVREKPISVQLVCFRFTCFCHAAFVGFRAS
jgi:hypothetical protein